MTNLYDVMKETLFSTNFEEVINCYEKYIKLILTSWPPFVDAFEFELIKETKMCFLAK